MRCLLNFNSRLQDFRKRKKLSRSDVAALCQCSELEVAQWESAIPSERQFPSIDALVNLCLSCHTPLMRFLDLPPDAEAQGDQLQLPGLLQGDEDELTASLNDLDVMLDEQLPDLREREFLTRFREADEANQALVLSMLTRA